MKNYTSNNTIIAITAFILGVPAATMAQTTVFNDTFANGSTVQTGTPFTPTANSTDYEYFQQGGVPATPTIASGDLHLAGRTTASSISEVQALFTGSPVTLATVGDSIDLNVVFTDTQNIFPTGSASTLNIGLYNSGSSAPVKGVRLDSTGSGTGGAVGWQGYNARIGGTGSSSPVFTRAAQGAGTTNPNQSQDALFNGASGSATYNNPVGVSLGSGPLLAAGLTGGSVYNLDYKITLSAAGTLTISDSLYSGSTVNALNLLSTETGTASGATLLTTSFDAMALGWRFNSASAANSIDIGSISVADSLAAVPEPGTMSLFGIGAMITAAGIYRRSRK